MTLNLMQNACVVCMLFTPFYALIRWLIVRKKSTDFSREAIMFIFAEYIIALLYLTLDPTRFFNPLALQEGWFYRTLQIVPFRTISIYFSQGWNEITMINVLANILIFVPFGFLLPSLWESFRFFGKVFLYGTIFIVAIESIQWLIGRSADIDDYLLNIVGVIVGYGIWSATKKLAKK